MDTLLVASIEWAPNGFQMNSRQVMENQLIKNLDTSTDQVT